MLVAPGDEADDEMETIEEGEGDDVAMEEASENKIDERVSKRQKVEETE